MGKVALKRENIPLLLFYIAYAIEVAIVLIDKSAYINPIQGRLFQLTFVLCTLKVAMTRYTNKEWALMIAFLVLGAVSYLATDRNDIIRYVMFVAASKGIDLKKLLKATFWVTLIGVLLLMTLSLIGVLGWNYVEGDFDGDGPEGIMRRYCFGLGHPNALHCMFFCILLLAILVYWKKINIGHYIAIFIGNLILYCFTDSKTGMIITVVFVIGAVFFRYSEKTANSWYVGAAGILWIIFATIFSVLNAKYGYGIIGLEKLDQYLTGRLWIASAYGDTGYWSMFSVPQNTYFFDMGYNRLFYWYGVIPTVIYLLVICQYLYYLFKKKDYSAFWVVFTISIYTLVEAHFVSSYIARNYIIILLFGCWNEVFHVAGRDEKYFYQLIGQKNKQTEF